MVAVIGKRRESPPVRIERGALMPAGKQGAKVPPEAVSKTGEKK